MGYSHFFLCLLTIGQLATWSDAAVEEVTSPQDLYFSTVREWQTSGGRNWSLWNAFAKTVWQKFEGMPPVDNGQKTAARLDWVGNLEEGILAIERVVFQGGQGKDAQRDAALSVLYMTYSQTLLSLTAVECHKLALDPHTMLIGAETVKEPSTHLCHENAENSLRNAVTLDATNQAAVDILEQLTGQENAVHKRKPKEFVAELFDSFANSFDDKLLVNLQYKVPGLVGELAKHLLGEEGKTYDAILDAGCGTGLAGRHLRPLLSGVMVGVDASQKMLDKAALCTLKSGCGLETTTESTSSSTNSDETSPPLYEALLQMDLEDMTIDNTLRPVAPSSSATSSFDLIVAADVFVYFGSLQVILAKFAELQQSSGVLIFSTELATEEEAPLGWRLLGSGRFAHTKQHVLDAADQADYTLVSYQEIVPRMEKGEPVRGQLFGFAYGGSEAKTEEL